MTPTHPPCKAEMQVAPLWSSVREALLALRQSTMANSKRNSPFNKHGMLWNLQKCMELFNLLHWMLMD